MKDFVYKTQLVEHEQSEMNDNINKYENKQTNHKSRGKIKFSEWFVATGNGPIERPIPQATHTTTTTTMNEQSSVRQ